MKVIAKRVATQAVILLGVLCAVMGVLLLAPGGSRQGVVHAATLAPLSAAQWVPWVQPTWDESMTNEHGTLSSDSFADCCLWEIFSVGSSRSFSLNPSASAAFVVYLNLNYDIRILGFYIRPGATQPPDTFRLEIGETHLYTQLEDRNGWVRGHTLAEPIISRDLRFLISVPGWSNRSFRYISIIAERLMEPETPPDGVLAVGENVQSFGPTVVLDSTYSYTELTTGTYVHIYTSAGERLTTTPRQVEFINSGTALGTLVILQGPNLPAGYTGRVYLVEAEPPIPPSRLYVGTTTDKVYLVTVEHGEDFVLPVPERDGYMFMGWQLRAGNITITDEYGQSLAPWELSGTFFVDPVFEPIGTTDPGNGNGNEPDPGDDPWGSNGGDDEDGNWFTDLTNEFGITAGGLIAGGLVVILVVFSVKKVRGWFK